MTTNESFYEFHQSVSHSKIFCLCRSYVMTLACTTMIACMHACVCVCVCVYVWVCKDACMRACQNWKQEPKFKAKYIVYTVYIYIIQCRVPISLLPWVHLNVVHSPHSLSALIFRLSVVPNRILCGALTGNYDQDSRCGSSPPTKPPASNSQHFICNSNKKCLH